MSFGKRKARRFAVGIALCLIGMLGIDKRPSHYSQHYGNLGSAHEHRLPSLRRCR